jgi:hypothetical protein
MTDKAFNKNKTGQSIEESTLSRWVELEGAKFELAAFL